MNKRILLIAGTVCVLAIAGFFGFTMYSESKVRSSIETFLADLPEPLKVKAEKIDVSLSDSSATLINLKGTYTFSMKLAGSVEQVPVNFSIDRVEAVGVNMDGFKPGAGVAKLFNSLTFKNTVFDSPMAKGSIETYRFEDISCNAELFAKEFAKALPSLMAANASETFPRDEAEAKKLFTDLGSLIRAYETVNVGRLVCEKYIYSLDLQGQKIDTDLGLAEVKGYSIRNIGPFTMQKLNVAVDGAPVVALESISADATTLPSFTAFFETMANTAYPSPQMLRKAFKGQTFALNNLRLKNLTVLDIKNKDKIIFSLEDTAFSYTAETDHVMDLALNNLKIQKSLLVEKSGLPPVALASLPDTITLEAVLQQTVTPKESAAFDLDCKKIFLKGTGLGEATLSAAANNINTMALIMGAGGDVVLKNIDLAVTDAGLSEVLFTVNGLFDGKSAAQARADEVASLRRESENELSAIEMNALTSLISFIEKPDARMRVVLAPPKPKTVDELREAFLADDSAGLGLSITVDQAN